MSERRLRPTVIVIGAQKGGTTALFTYLSNHPGTVPPSMKEINFFSCPSRYACGLDFYHSHFAREDASNRGLLTFDVTPDYLVSPVAADRIARYDPGMKLIAMLRDPIHRAYSAWHMYRGYQERDPEWFFGWMQHCDEQYDRSEFQPRGPAFGRSFEDDVVAELEARSAGRQIEMPFLSHGFYHRQLSAYLSSFERRQLLVVCSEEFFARTTAVFRSVEEFVGLRGRVDAERLEPVFVNEYDKRVPARAVDILKSVYDEENKALYSLVGKELPWL